MDRIEIDIGKKLDNYELRVSLKSNAGRIGILGESGAGKSMTLKCIAGIEKPDMGWIEIDGIALFDSWGKINLKVQNRHAGYLFQDYALFPTMTVYENTEAGTYKDDPRIREYLRKFDIAGIADAYPGKLSGGQKQRVALARMLIANPEIIMLDEPFSALDSTLKDKMQQELDRYLSDYKGIVIMVSHNRDEIYRFCDEIYVIRDGNIIEGGSREEIFQKPHKRETARLTGCKNISEIKRIDDHHAYAPKWNLNIVTVKEIPKYAEYIGYRAHDFIPVFKTADGDAVEENHINVSIKDIAHLPFETNLYYEIKNSDERISCFVSKDVYDTFSEKGIPKVLKLREDKMLFLQD